MRNDEYVYICSIPPVVWKQMYLLKLCVGPSPEHSRGVSVQGQTPPALHQFCDPAGNSERVSTVGAAASWTLSHREAAWQVETARDVQPT